MNIFFPAKKEAPVRDRDLLALGALPENRWFLDDKLGFPKFVY